METAERLDTTELRAHWQRTEGMVIFDRVFRQAFPLILDRIDPERIADCKRKCPAMDDLELAYVAARHVVDQTAHVTPGLTESPDDELSESLRLYTHAGLRFGLNEGIDSTVFLPLNLMKAADHQSPAGSPNLTERLSDISTTFRRPFFGELIDTAAFTANGVWGRFASTKVPGINLSLFLRMRAPHFEYHDGTNGLEYDFTDAVKQHLLTSLRNRNQVARQRHEFFPDMPETTAMGTTSGCPVAHEAPRFTQKPRDVARLQRLAEYYQTAPEDLTRPRSESAIVFGLRRFGEFLERVEDCL